MGKSRMASNTLLGEEITVEILEGSLWCDAPDTFPVKCVETGFGPMDFPKAFNEKILYLLLTLYLNNAWNYSEMRLMQSEGITLEKVKSLLFKFYIIQ